MQEDLTWENPDFRCSVCISIFSPESGSAHEPIIICANMHTICRTCALQTTSRGANCPACRIQCNDANDLKSNRYLVSFVERFKMRCGSCSLQTLMPYEEIARHQNTCPLNKIQCPFPSITCVENKCGQVVSVSALWEHCRTLHASETHTIECDEVDSAYTGSLSLPITFNARQNIFMTLSGNFGTLNTCLHVYEVRDDDCRSSVCCAVRRFFGDDVAKITKILLSMEMEDYYGIVMPVHACLEAHAVLEAADFDHMDTNVVRIPKSLLRKMHDQCPSVVKCMLSVQINFEMAPTDDS
jgi:hypothetical protein